MFRCMSGKRSMSDADGEDPRSGSESRRQIRHEELLDAARELLIKNGLSGLGIDQLAKLTGYSRPTIYGHFSSKDAVLDALALRNLEVTRALTAKAAEFEGTLRERAFAMILGYEVLARFHSDEFHVTEALGMPWVLAKLPEEIAAKFAAMVTSYSDTVTALAEEAVAAGELKPSGGLTVGMIVFHSLSMTYGIYTSIVKNRIILRLSKPVDPWEEARRSLHCFWDGLGWGGTSEEVDYGEVADRFLRQQFPDFWVQLEVERIKREAGLGGDKTESDRTGESAE